jgi:hypothetical protein
VTQIVWYGSVRTPFTFEFLKEWMAAAGFTEIKSSRAGLASLDNRERESLFVEARRNG